MTALHLSRRLSMMMMNPMLAASRLQNRLNKSVGLHEDTPIPTKCTAAKLSLHRITLQAHYKSAMYSGKNEYLAEIHFNTKARIFSRPSIRLPAYTKHEYFIC